ncbi:Cytochrome c6 [Nymphaea thermarum]|nr:Cytochrome c6 [Nymphaea thermarum]
MSSAPARLKKEIPTEHFFLNFIVRGMGFGEKCTPRGQCTFGPRLQDDEIKLLAMFVKSQAEQGWPNIEIYKY